MPVIDRDCPNRCHSLLTAEWKWSSWGIRLVSWQHNKRRSC